MISFALPWVMAVAGLGALAITALHLLSVRRPPELLLPTARFLPDRDVRAVSRTKRPSDLLLLALRLLLILAAGVAIAGPSWRTSRRSHAIIIAVGPDITRDSAALRRLALGDSTNASTRDTRVLLTFADSTQLSDDIGALMPMAIRAASELASNDAGIDSLSLYLVASRGASDSVAFDAWRQAWNGRVVTLVAAERARPRGIVISAPSDGDDHVVPVAVAWHAARISRGALSPVDTVMLVTDSTGARSGSGSGTIRLYWPETGVPVGWQKGRSVDSASAVAVGGQALAGPWPITSRPDTIGDDEPLAWYSDGSVAATERFTDGVCERRVSLKSPIGSDRLLSPSANALFDRLLAPCERREPLLLSALSARAQYGEAFAPADAFRTEASATMSSRGATSWLTPILLGLSVVLLLVEWWVRAHRPDAIA